MKGKEWRQSEGRRGKGEGLKKEERTIPGGGRGDETRASASRLRTAGK